MILSRLTSLQLVLALVAHALSGPDYESLPLKTIFPGPWEDNIRAPVNKSYIVPVKVLKREDVKHAGHQFVIGPGGLITLEFAENIGGRVCFEVDDLKHDPYLTLAYSESPFFAGRLPDATNDNLATDLPLLFRVRHKGINCVGPSYIRGAFKYLTIYMQDGDAAEAQGFWHEGHAAVEQKTLARSWYERFRQTVLGKLKPKRPGVAISAVWVNCTAFPSNPNGRAYTGYFDSSSSLLNRIWYAGAWTLQLSTLDPREGGALISYNRNFDHNTAPEGAWFSNFTIANGTAVTTDGAKRDRMVWPGDMTIAIPGIAVSTYDMLAVRNALDTIYEHQYGDGGMPYAGPPMGSFGEFSDTYHLHTLMGSYIYVLYSGDLEWLRKRWPAYLVALKLSLGKVDEFNLLHVTSTADWLRPGMSGHNVEASALLHEVLTNSIKLSTWLSETTTSIPAWQEMQGRLQKGIATLYCEEDGLFADNKGRRGCNGPEKVLPQDGNSWLLISQVLTSSTVSQNISSNLRKRWTKLGAPAVEFPNVISPFASSFELLAHIAAGNPDAAVELTELMWGYMLDGPGMTNSTLCEGYRTDGYIHYPAYPSPARNSHAHGWATGPTTVMMQGVLGIKLETPLGKTWSIQPVLTKWLDYARGGFATKLGKFEVVMRLMMQRSSGRRVEILEAMVPEGTSGVIRWGGKEQYLSALQEGETKFKFWRYVDDEGVKHSLVWSLEKNGDFVKDETWNKPGIIEREVGTVDWEALEANYELARGPEKNTEPTPRRCGGARGKKPMGAVGADILKAAADDFSRRVQDEEERMKNAGNEEL